VAYVSIVIFFGAGSLPLAPRSARAAETGAGDLHRAAAQEDLGELRKLLDSSASVDEKDPSGWTPLDWAVIAGNTDAASLLLDRGADPNARSQLDMTPLHWAAIKGRADMVGLLTRRGGRTDARDVHGMTPLHDAADETVVQALLAAGAQLGAQDRRGMTPLHTARRGAVAKAMLKAGADFRIVSRDGLTALDLATFDALEPSGLSVWTRRADARLRGLIGRARLTIRSVSELPIEDLVVSATSPACDVVVLPGRIARLAPGQISDVVLSLARRQGIGDGELPLIVTVSVRGAEIGKLELKVDTTAGETAEDRGMVKLSKGSLRPAPSRLYYLVYALVPALVVAAWLLARRRSR